MPRGRKPGTKDTKPRAPRGSKKAAPTSDGRPATTEHNKAKAATDLTDEQMHALTAHHAAAYEKALAVKKDGDAKFKNVCKLAKGDGVKVTAIKKFIDAETPEGQARIKLDVEESARIARWKSADLGFAFKLWDIDDTNSFQRGKEHGVAGAPCKSPAGLDPVEYARGWQEGQRIKLSSIKKFDNAPPTAPDDLDEKDVRPPFLRKNGKNDSAPAVDDDF